jgi:hypothetical protein
MPALLSSFGLSAVSRLVTLASGEKFTFVMGSRNQLTNLCKNRGPE